MKALPASARHAKPPWAAAAYLSVALLSLCGGFVLAWHHPLWPLATTAAFTAWVLVAARYRGLWLFVLPAVLPLMNFSPWTGWLGLEEFDLVVVGLLAAGLGRLAWEAGRRCLDETTFVGPTSRLRGYVAVALLFGGLGVVELCRGVADAGGWAFAWFDGYAQALNTLRVGKSLFYALALLPLLRDEFARSTPRAIQRLTLGMQVGLMGVGLAVLWERAAYPGLLDFSSRYRTTALFWEMHVGGAAIDAYLVLATPFAAWALYAARSRRAWAAAAFLALLTCHACLTTFSRGVYIGVATPLLLLGIAWLQRTDSGFRLSRALRWVLSITAGSAVLAGAFAAMGYLGIAVALTALLGLLLVLQNSARSPDWRSVAAMALSLALVSEAVIVIGGGTFLRARLDASEGDFGARAAHWRHGLNLLNGPMDWLFGIGLGRLPARYAHSVPREEFSGALSLVPTGPAQYAAQLSGPATVDAYAGFYFLSQRVSLRAGGPYRVELLMRVAKATKISVDVCEQHLLYTRQCQGAVLRALPQSGGWQRLAASLEGPSLAPGPWYAPRLGMFSLSVRGVGSTVELATVSLTAPDGTELLANRDFSSSLAHWFPVAQSYFLPWHIDNLYLELLIERGVVGLALYVWLLAYALRTLLTRPRGHGDIAPFLAASLVGAMLLGTVSSIMDVPRVALLLLLLVIAAVQLNTGAHPRDDLPV